MRQFWAGAALTALMTVTISGIVAGKVYVPVATSSSGLAEAAPAQQAPAATPTPIVTVLIDPENFDRPVDGPLAIAITSATVAPSTYDPQRDSPYVSRCPCVDLVVTLTDGGIPVPGVGVSDPSVGYANTKWGTTDARGQITARTWRANGGAINFARGQTLYYDFAATYQGRSVAITKRFLMQ